MTAAASAPFPFKGSDGAPYTNQTLPIDGSGNVPMSAGGVLAATAARQDSILAALAPLATDADLLTVVNKVETVRALLAAALTINLPAGASTAALQSAGNSSLANILTALSTLATDADVQATTAKVESVRALLAATLTVQGTVTANLGTLNGAALDATVSALGAKLDTLHADSGTTLHADLGALLTKLGTTLAVSAAALPLPTGAATAAKQPALGTAGSPSTDVLTVQGPAGQALSVTTTPSGIGGFLPIPAGTTNGTPIGTRPAGVNKGVIMSLMAGEAVTFTIQTTQPGSPPLTRTLSLPSGSILSEYSTDLAGAAMIYVTAITGSPLFRWY